MENITKMVAFLDTLQWLYVT